MAPRYYRCNHFVEAGDDHVTGDHHISPGHFKENIDAQKTPIPSITLISRLSATRHSILTLSPHPAATALRLISEFQKFRLPSDPNQFTDSHRPVPQRGVAHVTNAGRDAMDVGSARDERGLLAYGQVVSF